jgi:hypothetical protein
MPEEKSDEQKREEAEIQRKLNRVEDVPVEEDE